MAVVQSSAQESAEELGELETLGEGSDHFPIDLEFALLEDSTHRAVIGHMKMKSSSKKLWATT